MGWKVVCRAPSGLPLSADMTYGILWSDERGNLVKATLTHFISLKHVILAFYWLTSAV